MALKCWMGRHRWLLIEKIGAAPQPKNQPLKITGGSEQFIGQAIFGVTTLIFQCQDCRKMHVKSYLGQTQEGASCSSDSAERQG